MGCGRNHNAAHVAVINQTIAQLYFPNGDALGHSLKVPEMRDEPPFNVAVPEANSWLQIVGVIPDKRDDGLRKPSARGIRALHALDADVYPDTGAFGCAALSLLHAVGMQVNSVDPDQQIYGDVQDLEHWITSQQEWEREHLVAWLFGSFAMLAQALAAVGLYSVVSYSVAQRTNEFGIRVALGAQRAHVLKIVFTSTVVSVGSGIVAGVVLTLALNKVLAQWAEGSSRDPLILLAVTLLLSLVAVIACAGPARKALGVDPMTALRYE